MRYLTAFLLVASLTACGEPSEEQRNHVREHLPSGCYIKELGSYGMIDSLVVVICDGRQTTTSNIKWTRTCGKGARCAHYAASAQIVMQYR